MATDLISPSKITSPGSQYSVSASDVVTVPNPTPHTEALDSEVVDPPPEIDFNAMSKTLATIAEGLNESAEEAMYPTPPINTPVITSPTTSVIYRYPYVRGCGWSTIDDKINKAAGERRKFGRHDSDVMSAGDRSSMPPDDESEGPSDMLSEGGKHDILIALGSPRVNPMGLISFTSNDLADRPPLPFNSTARVEDGSATGIGSGSYHPDSQLSNGTGVTEMTNWREEVEGRFERAVKCLENLADDEHQHDPTRSAEYYYEAYLKRLLGGRNRKIPVSVDLVGDSQ